MKNLNAVELTKRMVRIESTNPGAGEERMEAFIRAYLEGCGARIDRDFIEPGRNNLIATIPGENPSPMLVWICHMDTVVVGSNWMMEPFEAVMEDGKIYGRGSCDMKAGLACALSVFRKTACHVQDGKMKLKYPLRLICTVDEEGDMKGVDHIVDSGFVTERDWVLDLEPTNGEIQMAHKGRLWVELSVHGVTAHASKPEEGADAVAAAGEIISLIRKNVAKFKGTTVTFGQIKGGYQPYVVPDECRLWMDFRTVCPDDANRIMGIVEKACEEAKSLVKGVWTDYRITGNRPGIEINRQSHLLESLKKSVFWVTGEKLEAGVFPGYTDSAVIAGRLNNHECLSYGPGDLKYAHKPDEFVEIKDIERCERVLVELIYELI